MVSEKLLIDPHSPAYEAARAEMVEVLRQIGREDSLNGYTQMADDLAVGNLMEVPTWIALALMAARAPADLRSALEALERAATTVHRKGAVTGPQWSQLSGALITARAALAPTKELAA